MMYLINIIAKSIGTAICRYICSYHCNVDLLMKEFYFFIVFIAFSMLFFVLIKSDLRFVVSNLNESRGCNYNISFIYRPSAMLE